jgi:hypothetical protein
MGWNVAYIAAGLVLTSLGMRVLWSAWIGPSRDWSLGRGRWVTARVVRVERMISTPGPPYWARSPRIQISYELDGQPQSGSFELQRTKVGQYVVGQDLDVFRPETSRALPRTAEEPGFPETRFGGAALLVLLGLLVIAAGIVPIIRGT